VGDERSALNAWLDRHRATLLLKLDGLSEEQARRAVLPSGLSLLSLVKHLTAVEHGWFVVDFAQSGEDYLFLGPNDDGELDRQDWQLTPDDSLASVTQAYRDACRRSRAVAAAASSLDQLAPHPSGGVMDLRFVLVHLLEETARHNGHADAVRELIDGVTRDRGSRQTGKGGRQAAEATEIRHLYPSERP